MNDLDVLADLLKEPTSQDLKLIYGKVISRQSDGTVTVQLRGDTTTSVAGVKCLEPVGHGNTVLIAKVGIALLVLGSVSATSTTSGIARLQNPLSFLNPSAGDTGRYWVQGLSQVNTTDGNGDVTCTYPVTFPNAAVTFVAMDAETGQGLFIVSGYGFGSSSTKVNRRFVSGANATGVLVRTNWIALGY